MYWEIVTERGTPKQGHEGDGGQHEPGPGLRGLNAQCGEAVGRGELNVEEGRVGRALWAQLQGVGFAWKP